MITAPLHLAWRYVSRHRLQTLLLAGALALVMALPLCLRVLVGAAESAMRQRASDTPQLLGSRGSALDLMLTALYFKRQPLPTVTMAHLHELRDTQLAEAIPLDARFHAQQTPIIGTEIEYFSFRHLRLAQGKMLTRLGDCVIGARVAAQRGLAQGGALFSSQEQVFDMAGVYPLKMRITGVLAANGSADDDAIFVDLKTTWLIEGLAHGHDDVSTRPDAVLKATPDNLIANSSVRMFSEVTDANLGSFHFHGDDSAHQLSAIIVRPKDAKSEALLAGRYQKSSLPVQLIRPIQEYDLLMSTLFQMEKLAYSILAVTLLAAATVSALVFTLSFRIRRREFRTLADIGISPRDLILTKAFEAALVGALSLLFAGLITALVQWNAAQWIRQMLS
jgi:putative ABC transport system permease protein